MSPSSPSKMPLSDALTTAIILLDSKQIIEYVNPACEALLGVSASRLLGSSIKTFLERVNIVSEGFLQALAAKQSFRERDLKVYITSTRSITIDCTVTPINLVEDDGSFVIEMHHNDSHKRIAKDYRQLIQYQNAQWLTRSLAHEIKNPLSGLRGAAQLLEKQIEQPLQEYTQVIIREADRLTKLVSRLDAPAHRPTFKSINIHEVIEHVRKLVEAEKLNGIEVARDYDPSLPNVVADSELLIQAFLNIAKNALNALQKNGSLWFVTRAERQVTLGRDHYRTAVRVDIIDNGPGIADDLIERIFYPLVSGNEGGTGLGLSIAQSIIQQHQGHIGCVSRPGETVFTVLLPLEQDNDNTTTSLGD